MFEKYWERLNADQKEAVFCIASLAFVVVSSIGLMFIRVGYFE